MSAAIDQATQEILAGFPFPSYAGEPLRLSSIVRIVERHLARGATILDFGCGSATVAAILGRLGYRVTGYDDFEDAHLDPGRRESVFRFAAEHGVSLVAAAGGPLPFVRETFDLVIVADVLEHLHDSPREILNELLEATSPRGYLLVTVPNAANVRKRIALLRGRTNLPAFDGYFWSSGRWRGHVREYVKDDLRRMSANLGLETVELRACDHMLPAIRPFLRRPYLAATGLFPGLKDSWLLVARKPPGWQPRQIRPNEKPTRRGPA